MKKLLFILLVLAAGSAAGFLYYKKDSGKLEAVQPIRGPAVQAVYATGTVEPSVLIPVAPRQAARLIALMADEGQTVKKGEVLAQLEDTDLQNTLTELQAKADLAEKDYNRKNELYRRKATSEQDLDQAKAARDAARATVERARAELSYLQLRAAEDGLVIRREGEVGEMIASNQPVFWMSCCKPLRIVSEVDEEDIALVQPGQKVLIAADAYPGETFSGKVLSITPKGDPVARSYRVRIGLDGDQKLMIGMTAETNIVTQEKESALLVPLQSVADGKIWTVESGKLKSRPVRTGMKTLRAIEILEGIDENSVVITDADRDMKDGQDVSVMMKEWKAE